jgi:hypothetical protein
MNIYAYAFLGLPVIFLILAEAVGSGECFLLLLLMWAVGMHLINSILWKLPVNCERSSCTGQMEKSGIRISTFRTELHYQCNQCNYVYKTKVFDSTSGTHRGKR